MIPESERFPGEGTAYPLQSSCLKNPMDREAWWATVHGSGGLVANSYPTLMTLWTVACQVLRPMGFSRQEYWNGLPFTSPGDLPDRGEADSLLTVHGV